MAVKARQAEVEWQALDDAILEKKTDSLLECFLDDDSTRMLVVLRSDVSYDFALKQGKFQLPKILRNGSTPIMHAAFLGAVKCVHTLIDLSINPKATDGLRLTAAHFACAGGIFDICREFDNLGVDFALMSESGSPAKMACEFGRDELVFWLWTRGALLAMPQVGWRSRRGEDPDVLCAAALHGHSKVVRILVESVGIKFNAALSVAGESAVTCACRNGHDEVLEVLFGLGASVNETALPAAIRSGSLRCVEELLLRKVKVDSEVLELATACGHADVLGRLLGVCSDFGNSWLAACLDDFGDGQRLLEAAGARPATWTGSVLRFLMERPGSAVKFAGFVPLPETIVGDAEWKMEELRAVVVRLLRDKTASAPVLHALLEGNWSHRGGPFRACTAAEFARLELPSDLRTIGGYAFSRCSGLTHVDIPPGLTTIGEYAFFGCSNLTRVVIPPSVSTIRDHAFAGCSGLRQIELPSSFDALWKSAFEGVTNVERLTLVGSRLSASVIASFRTRLARTAKVVGAGLAGRGFGRFTIASA